MAGDVGRHPPILRFLQRRSGSVRRHRPMSRENCRYLSTDSERRVTSLNAGGDQPMSPDSGAMSGYGALRLLTWPISVNVDALSADMALRPRPALGADHRPRHRPLRRLRDRRPGREGPGRARLRRPEWIRPRWAHQRWPEWLGPERLERSVASRRAEAFPGSPSSVTLQRVSRQFSVEDHGRCTLQRMGHDLTSLGIRCHAQSCIPVPVVLSRLATFYLMSIRALPPSASEHPRSDPHASGSRQSSASH
jgi:hypothetical protein